MKKVLFFVFVFLFLSSCIRLKVSNLNSSLYAKIKVGTDINSIQVKHINGIPVNIPLQVIVENGLIYIPDYYNSYIKVFNIYGNLVSIYGKEKPKLKPDSKIRFQQLDINLLGFFSVAPDKSIFLQIRENTKDINLDNSKKYINPSFILHIANDGSSFQKIGMNGVNSKLPFHYIESIISPRKDKLYIYHSKNDKMVLSFFDKGALKVQISKENFDPYIKNDLEKYNISLEKIVPHPDGNYYFVSFVYLKKENQEFAFKKLFKYNNQKRVELIREISNINESPIIVLNTSQYYIKQVDKKNIIDLQLNDINDQAINKLRLNLSNINNLWRNIFINNKNEIFSTNMKANSLEIFRWK